MSAVPTTKILWISFSLMTICTTVQWILTTRQQANNKLLHHISLTLSTFTMLTYYFVLTDINVNGSYIWIRGFHWILTFPLVLLQLGLISAISIQDLLVMTFNGIGLCLTGFLCTLERSNSLRWPLVLMAWIFWLSIVRELLTNYLLTKSFFATWVLIGVSIIPEANVIGASRYIEARNWNSIGGNLDQDLISDSLPEV